MFTTSLKLHLISGPSGYLKPPGAAAGNQNPSIQVSGDTWAYLGLPSVTGDDSIHVLGLPGAT